MHFFQTKKQQFQGYGASVQENGAGNKVFPFPSARLLIRCEEPHGSPLFLKNNMQFYGSSTFGY